MCGLKEVREICILKIMRVKHGLNLLMENNYVFMDILLTNIDVNDHTMM